MKLTKEEQNKLNEQLFDAVDKNDLDAVKATVAAGADVNSWSDYNSSFPLYRSVRDSVDITILQFLLEHGADPNLLHKHSGRSILRELMDNGGTGKKTTAKLLLLIKYNVNLYIKDIYGRTAFSAFLKRGQILTAQKMVLSGYIPANEDFLDIPENVKILIPQFTELKNLSKHDKNILLQQMDIDEQMYRAIFYNSLNTLKTAVEAGANINALRNNGASVLHMAMWKNITLLEYLLELRVNPNIQDNDGNTALHDVGCCDFSSKAKLLLKHNADMYIKNNHGETPFAACLKLSEPEFDSAECLILEGYIPTEDELIKITDIEKKTYFIELADKIQRHKAKLRETIEAKNEIYDNEIVEF